MKAPFRSLNDRKGAFMAPPFRPAEPANPQPHETSSTIAIAPHPPPISTQDTSKTTPLTRQPLPIEPTRPPNKSAPLPLILNAPAPAAANPACQHPPSAEHPDSPRRCARKPDSRPEPRRPPPADLATPPAQPIGPGW